MAHEVEQEDSASAGKFASVFNRVWQGHDYSTYGGAPLLGVDGGCIICHGRSDEFAVCNAVKVARAFVEDGFNEAIRARLG